MRRFSLLFSLVFSLLFHCFLHCFISYFLITRLASCRDFLDNPAEAIHTEDEIDPVAKAVADVKYAKSIVDRRLKGEQNPMDKRLGTSREKQLEKARDELKQRQATLASLQSASQSASSTMMASAAATELVCADLEAGDSEVRAALSNLMRVMKKRSREQADSIDILRDNARSVEAAAAYVSEEVQVSSFKEWPIQIKRITDDAAKDLLTETLMSLLAARGFGAEDVVLVGKESASNLLEGFYAHKRKSKVWQKVKLLPGGAVIGVDCYLYFESTHRHWRIGKDFSDNYFAFSSSDRPHPEGTQAWKIH